VLERGTADDLSLHQRVRHSHDLWNVVAGCPPSPAGEAALSAINVMQLRWPGSARLIGADLMHHCLEGPESDHAQPKTQRACLPADPDVGLAVAYGLELGAACAPLLTQRWEEGWAWPLAAWRERLGIAAIVARSPFAASYVAAESTPRLSGSLRQN
jgi:ubiquinone biosynthesis protein Coq4